MLEDQIEERLDYLTKKVEELSTEVEALKRDRDEEITLIPGAEYDFVPSYEPEVVGRGVARFVGFAKAPNDLGLSQREWELLTPDEEEP